MKQSQILKWNSVNTRPVCPCTHKKHSFACVGQHWSPLQIGVHRPRCLRSSTAIKRNIQPGPGVICGHLSSNLNEFFILFPLLGSSSTVQANHCNTTRQAGTHCNRIRIRGRTWDAVSAFCNHEFSGFSRRCVYFICICSFYVWGQRVVYLPYKKWNKWVYFNFGRSWSLTPLKKFHIKWPFRLWCNSNST